MTVIFMVRPSLASSGWVTPESKLGYLMSEMILGYSVSGSTGEAAE
jgi:hypothetical protein